MAPTVVEFDYLVVGAGTMGMASTDALVAHADVSVVLADRNHSPGGHQASSIYGVASMLLGDNRIQGPEAGMDERASAPEICAYTELGEMHPVRVA